MAKTTKDNFAEPLLSKAKLEELQEEYSVVLCEIIEYIIKELDQSIERQTVPEKLYKFWRKYSTEISIPKAVALEMGYGDDKFIVVRGIVNNKFHIYEEYETKKDNIEQIIFLLEPKLISKQNISKSNDKSELYYEAISEEVKKYLKKLSKNEYEDLCEQIRINETIEIPIVSPEEIYTPTLYKYLKRCPEVFKNISGFRRPHVDSEARKQGYNLYVKVTGLDF